mgnify:CR=1 FL=1
MLAEFMRDRTLTPGEQILCYVPESGRFMTAYMLLEVEACDAPAPAVSYPSVKQSVAASSDQGDIAPPHDPATAPQGLRDLLTQLAPIWHDYRSQVWRTPLLRSLHDGSIRMQDYQKWMADWSPHVREGAKWMREACDSLAPAYAPLAGLLSGGWVLPAVLGGLVIRKPGAALFVETVAATGELLMGSPYGTTVLVSGVVQGLGAELVIAAFRYRRFTLPVALLAGAGAGLAMGLNDCFSPWGWNVAYGLGDKFAYMACTSLSGAVIAGLLSWIATRGLSRTGALSAFASRRAASEPVL